QLPHFGKDQQHITGSCFRFRTRPDAIHDNRSSVIRRIRLQLVAFYEKENPQLFTNVEQHPGYPKALSSITQAFLAIPPDSTRYVSLYVAYPPGTDLIRGLSTRKGGDGFRQAVRDLFRKGAGSSQLTDYDTFAYSSTWNKIGHIYASHDKELHFGTN